MRIVCDGCQAKYSIADDKVRAKVFKIRCKKCSNVIVVRGADAAEPAPAPAAIEHDGDAIWHLVIDQEQVGPMTAADVHQRFAAGEIDGDTFTWREGLDEWLPLAQLDAFADLASSKSPALEPPQPLAAAPTSRARARDDRGDDLFGAQVAAAPAETSAQKLRGERNESSVLFSLGNLAQIANHRPAPVASTPATGSTTTGGGEGSGLIDIRSMASAYLGSPPAGAARTASAGIGSLDDLPVFGGGGFSEPAVLVPAARPATNTRLLYVMIGAVALLAIAAIVMMVMLLGGTRSAPQVAAATPPKPEPKHVATPPDEPRPVTPPPAEVKAPATEAPTPPPAIAPKAPPAHVATAPAQHKEPKEPKAHAPPPTEVPAQLKAMKETKETCDDISCVVNADSPCCVARRNNGAAPHDAPKKTETVDPNLPPKLVVGQITSTMATVKAKIMSCGDRTPAKGLVKIHLKVSGDGKVTDSSVETSPDPALGACVSAAAKRAVFPKTQTGGSFGIPYQF